jgi:hypothetical protein
MINFNWFEYDISVNPEQLGTNALSSDNGAGAYDLQYKFESTQASIANIDEQQVIHLNYQKNTMVKTTIDGSQTSRDYGTVTRDYQNTLKRTSIKQPYVTFRLHLDRNHKITTVVQNGRTFTNVILYALSLIGGLFTSIGAIAALIVG